MQPDPSRLAQLKMLCIFRLSTNSRFKLLHEHVLRFNQVELDDQNTTRPSLARDTAIRFNLFHNIAIVALLENRRTRRQVQVATTHLLADPAFPDAKMLQTAILTSKLEELKAKALEEAEAAFAAAETATASRSHQHPPLPQQQIPTILVGDFNSLPDSPVVNFLKTGQVETCHFGGNDFGRFTRTESKHFHHNLGLADSYGSSILPFTNATRKFQGTIDYLLYDPSSLGFVGFLDHLEPDPSWSQTEITKSNLGSSVTSSRTTANMSSSDPESELETDLLSSPPSSLASFATCSNSTRTKMTTRAKKSSRKAATTKKMSIHDLSLLFSNAGLHTSSGMGACPEPGIVRADIPTALPSQHFPSDHLPLVAIFREREHLLASSSRAD